MSPARQVIPYFRPRAINNRRFFSRVEDILRSRYFTNSGKMVRELEHEVARRHRVKHCVLVCNATIGLQLVLKALELEGEILTTPFTFVATAHAIMWQRLIPVFCDIDPDRLTISPQRIAELITPHTSAILGVHVFGQFCDVEAIARIAKKHRLKVIYDAAHSFMTSYQGTPVGNFGDAEVLSFHGTKLFHTFEGGAVLTNAAPLAARLRLLKNFGFEGLDTVRYIGTNAKMNEVSAAYGLSLLPAMRETIVRLRRIHDLYRAQLGPVPGVRLFDLTPEVSGNGQYLPLFIEENFGVGRDQLWAHLWNEGIQTRRYFYPGAHLCEPYRSEMPWFKDLLPVTRRVTQTILCLPCYYDLADRDIARICHAIARARQDGAGIQRWYRGLLKSPAPAPHMTPLVQALRRESLP